jgi:hypothetical protein
MRLYPADFFQKGSLPILDKYCNNFWSPNPPSGFSAALTAQEFHFACPSNPRVPAELLNCGAIFDMRIGKPAKRQMRFWLREIREWTRLKGQKGEVV